MPVWQLWAVAGATAVAMVVYASVGFGYGLVAIPLLIWSGLALPEAMAINIAGLLLHAFSARKTVQREVAWRSLLPLVAIGWGMLVVGNVLLIQLTQLPQQRVQQAVGVILLVILIAQWALRFQPRAHVPAVWGVLAFGLSGLIAGLCGLGGPPVVLWALAHEWSSNRTRGTLFAIFSLYAPLQLLVLSVAFGPHILGWALVGVLVFPALWVGSRVGLLLGARMSKGVLRISALVLLTALAVRAIVAPMIG
jgi:uncharacterized membrane protein YfcA